MKNWIIAGIISLCVAGAAIAQQVNQRILTDSAVIGGGAAKTATGTVRGTVNAMKVSVYDGGTANVSVATADGLTLFSKDGCTGDNWYFVRFEAHEVSGTAITSSGSETNKAWVDAAIVSDVTATFSNTASTTGAVSVLINYTR